MNDRLFSLCTPCPDGFTFCREFRVRDFRRAPFALHASSAGAGREFLGHHLSRLAGVILIPGDHYSFEEVAPLVSQIIFPPSILPCFADFAAHQLAQLDRYIDSEERLSFLTLENKRFELNNQRVSEEFSRFRESLLREIEERRATETALRESEERFRALVETSSDWIWEVNEQGVYTYSSPKIIDLLGYSPAELLGKTPFDLMPEEEAARVSRQFAELMKSHLPIVALENTNLHKDGSLAVLETGGVPIIDHAGVFRGYRGIDRDITERKRAEDALSERVMLAELSADIGYSLTMQGDLQSILNKCAEALVQRLDVAFARIWTFKAAENVLELQASAGMYTAIDGSHSRVPLGGLKVGLIAQERKPHVTNAVIGDPRVHDQEWAKREGMVAFAGHPLTVEERLVGVMAMFSRNPLTDVTIKALASVSNEIAIGIERKQAEDALRRHTEELDQCVKERTAELEAKNAELTRLNKIFVGRELRMVELKERIKELEKYSTGKEQRLK
jgi:PAS domain S-box-containing protein